MLIKRYLKQIFTSLFNEQAANNKGKEKEIYKNVDKLKKLQRNNIYKKRPRKKDTVL